MINLSYKPTLKGKKVYLRPFVTEDFPYLEKILTEEEVIKLTGSDSEFNREVVKKWYATRNEQIDRLDLAIIDIRSNQIVGEVVLNEYSHETNSMNFRILIGENGRDKGLGTEAMELFCVYIFEQTDLEYLTLSVFAFSPRARHVYEKVGFRVMSVDSKELFVDGEWIDSINMKLSRDQLNTNEG